MIWKIGIYLLFVALPASIITANLEENTTEDTVAMATASEMERKTDFIADEAVDEDLPTDGAILGSVITNAPDKVVEITATNGTKTIKGVADENGEFFMNGFDEGIYEVTIVTESKTDEQVNVEVFEDVEIRIGEVTELGTVTFAE